jgi:hypothetical protein
MAKVVKQLHITVDDAVGKLADVTGKIKAAGVNLLTAAAWVEGGVGHLTTITQDNAKAMAALQGAVRSVEEEEAVWAKVPSQVGSLHAAAKKLGDAGIAIHCLCATTSSAAEAGMVLTTSDNARAAKLL